MLFPWRFALYEFSSSSMHHLNWFKMQSCICRSDQILSRLAYWINCILCIYSGCREHREKQLIVNKKNSFFIVTALNCFSLWRGLQNIDLLWQAIVFCVNWALTSSLKTINAALNPLNKGIFLFSSWFTQVIIIRPLVYRQLIKDTSEAKEKRALGEKRSRYIDSLYSKFWFLIPYENISVVLNLDIKWFVMLFYW